MVATIVVWIIVVIVRRTVAAVLDVGCAEAVQVATVLGIVNVVLEKHLQKKADKADLEFIIHVADKASR